MVDKTAQTVRDRAAWTVMVYLAGDNNLTDESVYAMTEMRKVGSGDGVNIITQFDPKDEYLPTHRYRIKKRDTGNGTSRPLADDIIDTSKKTMFRESVVAAKHAAVRDSARVAAVHAVEQEAEKEVRDNPRGVSVQGQPQIRTTLFAGVLADTVINDNETDTGSPVTLYNFMSFCIEKYPADHYMVVLSGHGNIPGRGYLLKDDSPVSALTIDGLKSAFEQLKPELNGQVIDILGMDTCVMSTVEVAFELRGMVKIMVGSESYSPSSGWPYEMILRRLKDEIAQSTPEKESALPENQRVEYRFAKDIVEEYANFYADYWLGGLSVDQAALNVGEVEELKILVDAFANALTEGLEEEDRQWQAGDIPPEMRKLKDGLLLAHWEAQSYNGELFVDLFDFCTCLLNRYKEGDVFETGSTLQSFISSTFVLKSCYSGPLYQYSYGVSIYFPWSKIEQGYETLDFISVYRDSGWGNFLDVYTKLTRRDPRPPVNQQRSQFFKASREVEPERTRQTQGKGSESQNAVQSMRNPPTIAEPEVCIRAREEITEGIKMVFGLQ